MRLLKSLLNKKRLALSAGFIVIALLILGLLASCEEEKPTAPSTALRSQYSNPAVASAKGRIDIEGGVIHLAARRDGVISKVMVEEGDRVKAGQVLATLDDDMAQKNLALAKSETVLAKQEVQKAQIELKAAKREVNRLRVLAADDTIARQELDHARDERAIAGVALKTARATLATARLRESVVEQELKERQVLAPLDGRIIQRQARPGNGVSTLNVTPLFLFAPDVPRIIRAELEEKDIAVVSPGQKAEIILEADASQKWNGKVMRIGKVVGKRTPSDDPSERQDNRVVEVVISLDANDTLIGQRVIVRFLR